MLVPSLLASFFMFAARTAAHLPQHDHAGMVGEAVPEEILHRKVPLRSGIGTIHDKVATSSPEAQAFYDQGVAYLHSFVWIEAARSFNQALRLDQNLAMAFLGLSDAYIGLQEVPEARAAFDKAQTLEEKMGARDRARLTIRARQLEYLESDGNLQKYFAYRTAITEALAADPNDFWFWILRGFADEGAPLAHGQGGGIDTVAFYSTAQSLEPGNFVAHHYLAHTYENLGLRTKALEQSTEYVRLAPAIPHAHHMHGHDLRWTGHTAEAIQEFLKAEDLENAYYRSEDIPAKYDWHHAHNLQLLAMSYQSLGQMKAAEKAFQAGFSQPAYTNLAEYNRRAWPEFLLQRGRPQEALNAAQSLIASSWAMGRLVGHSISGRALLAMDRLGEARSELSLAERELESLPIAIVKSLPDTEVLRLEVLLHEKNWDEAKVFAQHVEDELDSVPGPDSWSEALFQLESIAQLARNTGDWELAETSARRMIHHDPSYAGGYFALGLVQQHRGETAAAKQQFDSAKKLWSSADDPQKYEDQTL